MEQLHNECQQHYTHAKAYCGCFVRGTQDRCSYMWQQGARRFTLSDFEDFLHYTQVALFSLKKIAEYRFFSGSDSLKFYARKLKNYGNAIAETRHLLVIFNFWKALKYQDKYQYHMKKLEERDDGFYTVYQQIQSQGVLFEEAFIESYENREKQVLASVCARLYKIFQHPNFVDRETELVRIASNYAVLKALDLNEVPRENKGYENILGATVAFFEKNNNPAIKQPVLEEIVDLASEENSDLSRRLSEYADFKDPAVKARKIQKARNCFNPGKKFKREIFAPIVGEHLNILIESYGDAGRADRGTQIVRGAVDNVLESSAQLRDAAIFVCCADMGCPDLVTKISEFMDEVEYMHKYANKIHSYRWKLLTTFLAYGSRFTKALPSIHAVFEASSAVCDTYTFAMKFFKPNSSTPKLDQIKKNQSY